MSYEIELKFTIDGDAIQALERHPLWQRLTDTRTERTVSTYYDTPDHALRAARIALRLRRKGGKWVQTVKSPGPPGREHVRGEWEHPRPDASFDLDLVEDERIREQLRLAAGAEGFGPVIATDFERAQGDLALAGGPSGGIVEFALDRGEMRRGDQTAPLCELELELKEGHPRILFDVARRLLHRVRLRFETRSKAQRAFEIGDDDPRRWSKAAPVALRKRMSTADALRAIARSCLAHLLAHERCAVDGREIEGVHQMRVACRRLRSILSLLRKYLPARAQELAAELRWFAGELGPARQWDVFLDETLAPLRETVPAEGPDGKSLEALHAAATKARARGYARARKAIGARRYTRMLIDLFAWLEEDLGERAGRPIGRVARRVLDQRAAKILAVLGERRELSDEELHDLRIDVKKLRYAAAFFASLFPKRPQARFAKALKRLQDALGLIQDVADTPAILGALRRSRRIERATELVLDHQAGLRAQALAAVEAPLADLVELKPYWR